VVLDGTQYFSSQHISCPQCSRQTHRNGTTTYSHRMLTPVIVAPHQNKVIPLPPEFIVPQDGHAKQDCENAAAKRWLHQYAPTYRAHNITISPYAGPWTGVSACKVANAEWRALR
jgi:hypothetical protein